jgi:hypothetical protein
MKLEGPDGSWQVEMRGPSQLTGADFRALQDIDDRVNGLDKGLWFGDDGDEWELSPDGVSMVKRPGRRKVSRQILNEGRDVMLARLISSWSFDSLPMPYQPGYLDSDALPLDAIEAIEKVRSDVLDRLRNGAPKEMPETTGDSSTTSKDDSTVPLPDSATTTAVPASGSAATAA